MNDLLTPDWIKRIRAEIYRKGQRAGVLEAERLLLAKTIEADGIAYWKDFVHWLIINAEGCEELGVIGSVLDLAKPDSQNRGVQVKLGQDYTNIFWDGGASFLRFCPLRPPDYRLWFNLTSKKELCVASKDSTLMSAKAVAELLVSQMYEYWSNRTAI